jgi:hypothetical protein
VDAEVSDVADAAVSVAVAEVPCAAAGSTITTAARSENTNPIERKAEKAERRLVAGRNRSTSPPPAIGTIDFI